MVKWTLVTSTSPFLTQCLFPCIATPHSSKCPTLATCTPPCLCQCITSSSPSPSPSIIQRNHSGPTPHGPKNPAATVPVHPSPALPSQQLAPCRSEYTSLGTQLPTAHTHQHPANLFQQTSIPSAPATNSPSLPPPTSTLPQCTASVVFCSKKSHKSILASRRL